MITFVLTRHARAGMRVLLVYLRQQTIYSYTRREPPLYSRHAILQSRRTSTYYCCRQQRTAPSELSWAGAGPIDSPRLSPVVLRYSVLLRTCVVGRAASGHLPGKKLCGRDTPEGVFSRDYSTPGLSQPVQEPAPPGVTSPHDHWQAPAR